ncbi:MAG: GFA family protein [Silicimonas sp.]|nr:GFA family protein [Silicimonas sp.]NND43364.1 GFA family protein [Silicimonas sp.]
MKGTCLCGAVEFRVSGQPEGTAVCHCSMCRKQSGHVWASAHVPDADLTVSGEVRWYHSSNFARRGFCPTCGSFLFWKDDRDPHVSFSLGALEEPTQLTLSRHIFTKDKGDYYEITDGLPQS